MWVEMYRGTYRTTNEKKGDSPHQWRVTNKWLQNNSHHPLHLKKAEHFMQGLSTNEWIKKMRRALKMKRRLL